MNIRNIAEALGYAFEKFIIHTIIFSIVFTLVYRGDNKIYIILSWCIPLAIGHFLGYLGGKCFSFFVEVKNVFWAIIYLLAINFIVGIAINKFMFNNEEWINFVVNISIPMVLGFGNSVSAGLKANVQTLFEDSEDNN